MAPNGAASNRHKCTFRQRTILLFMNTEYSISPHEQEIVMNHCEGDNFTATEKAGNNNHTWGDKLRDQASMRFNPSRSLLWRQNVDLRAANYTSVQTAIRNQARGDVLDAMRLNGITSRGIGRTVSNTPFTAGTPAEWTATSAGLAGLVPNLTHVTHARAGIPNNNINALAAAAAVAPIPASVAAPDMVSAPVDQTVPLPVQHITQALLPSPPVANLMAISSSLNPAATAATTQNTQSATGAITSHTPAVTTYNTSAVASNSSSAAAKAISFTARDSATAGILIPSALPMEIKRKTARRRIQKRSRPQKQSVCKSDDDEDWRPKARRNRSVVAPKSEDSENEDSTTDAAAAHRRNHTGVSQIGRSTPYPTREADDVDEEESETERGSSSSRTHVCGSTSSDTATRSSAVRQDHTETPPKAQRKRHSNELLQDEDSEDIQVDQDVPRKKAKTTRRRDYKTAQASKDVPELHNGAPSFGDQPNILQTSEEIVGGSLLVEDRPSWQDPASSTTEQSEILDVDFLSALAEEVRWSETHVDMRDLIETHTDLFIQQNIIKNTQTPPSHQASEGVASAFFQRPISARSMESRATRDQEQVNEDFETLLEAMHSLPDFMHMLPGAIV